MSLFSKNSKTTGETLLNSLGAIGDILAHEIANGGAENTEKYVSKFSQCLKGVLALESTDPTRFNELFYSKEYVDVLGQDNEEAGYRMYFTPERQLALCSGILRQLFRLHSLTEDKGNLELSYATYGELIEVLKCFSGQSQQKFMCNAVLDGIVREVYRVSREGKPASTFLAYRWYFSLYRKGFRIEYLHVFHSHLLSTLQSFVRGGYAKEFKSYVEYASHSEINRGDSSSRGASIFESLRHIDGGWEKSYSAASDIDKLLQSGTYSEERYSQVVGKLNEFDCQFRSSIVEEHLASWDACISEARQGIEDSYKYNSFLGLMVQVCAFCILMNKTDWLEMVWDFKQPDDTHTIWVGRDILPKGDTQLCDIYFLQLNGGADVEFNEGHHGAQVYVDRFFLLSMLRNLTRNNPIGVVDATDNQESLRTEISNNPSVRLENYPLPVLGSIGRHIDRLKDRIEDVFSEKYQGLNLRQDTDSKKALTVFLDALRENSENQLVRYSRESAISQTRVQEFMHAVANSFGKATRMRKLLRHFNLIEIAESDESNIARGINRLDEKAMFFDEWWISYGNAGEAYGEGLGVGDSDRILELVLNYCVSAQFSQLFDVLEVMGSENALILCSTKALYGYLHDSDYFVEDWKCRESENIDRANFGLPGFAGVLQIRDDVVPVFQTGSSSLDDGIIIVDKAMFGKMQIIESGSEDSSEFTVIDQLMMKVVACSENEELMTNILANPYKKLEAIDGDSARRDHLRTLVQIQIYSKLAYKPQHENIGFFLSNNPGEKTKVGEELGA